MYDYLYSLENGKEIPHTSEKVVKTFPNKDIWNDLLQYSWNKHKLDTGMEVINIYNSLGIAINDIAIWLKTKYKIIGMVNHPLGGLVNFVPLVEKRV